MAPPSFEFGVVVADGALGPLLDGLVVLVGTLERSPLTVPLARRVRKRLTIAGRDLLDRARLMQLGLDPARGAALFLGPSGPVLVLPVADRPRFVAAMGGKTEAGVDRLSIDRVCKPVAGRYACAIDVGQLDRLGAGEAPVADWGEELRGHVELLMTAPAVEQSVRWLGLGGEVSLRAGARLERGAATVRAHLTGLPSGLLAQARVRETTRLGAHAVDRSRTGLFVVNLAAPWRHLAPRMLATVPPRRLPGNVAMNELAGSLDGDAAGWVGGGSHGMARIGLSNEQPVRRVLGACGELSALAAAGLTFENNRDRCSLTIDPKRLDRGGFATEPFTLDAWVESRALVVAWDTEQGDAKTPPVLTGFAREIVAQPRLFGSWGRGSLIGAQGFATPRPLAGALGGEKTAKAIAFWLHHLNELGMWLSVRDDGVHAAVRIRTLWSNPDPVVAAGQKLIDDLLAGGSDGLARAQALARRFPSTPFASDTEAGATGLMLQTFAMAALSIAIQHAIKTTRAMLLPQGAPPSAHASDGSPAASSDPPKVVPSRGLEALRVHGDPNIQPPTDDALDMARTGKGTVAVVKMCLSARGSVDRLFILKSSGYPSYDAMLKAQMQTWQYRPFRVNGKPVPVCTSVTFIYRPRPPPAPPAPRP